MSRQLEAGELSQHTPPGTAATTPIRTQRSEVQPGGHVDNRLVAAECAYDALDEGFIRLVRIAQDPATGGIECRTEKFSLHNPPPYTALSYACGPRPANFNLELNGRDWKVRLNLSQFLRQRLQMDRDSDEWLWIDAICINLANNSERTHQVKLMADIYGKASRVIAWLGSAYEQSDNAMRGLLESKGDEQALELIPWILAVVHLCARPYWCRLWVLQELKLAREKDLMCGSKVIPWQYFERFMLRVDGKFNASPNPLSSRSTEGICRSRAMRMIVLTCTPVATSLLDLMEKSVDLQCEEPRDRVYALCGLATAEAASIDPDYENDIPVFLNMLFRHHVEQIPEISILTVTSTCERLECLIGALPGTIFELHSPENCLAGKCGPMYQRLCTRSIDMPGLTLLWAIQYEHLRVQELIKMVHRLRSPSYYMFWVLQGFYFIFGLILGLPLVPRSSRGSDLIRIIMGIVGVFLVLISINVAALRFSRMICSQHWLSKLTVHVGRDSEWEKRSSWSFYTALKHFLSWETLWWASFTFNEGLLSVAAPAFRLLKR
jgi:hypothetical protein